MKTVLKGATVVDPSQGICQKADILIIDGKIAEIKKSIDISGAKKVDLTGKVLTPGLIDMHVHLREPGFEYKEDIETGAMSGAAGGFTTLCCMPNTNPAIDNSALVRYIKSRSKEVGKSKVLPIGCVSKKQEGKEMAEIGDMAKAGAVAFSDDGKPIYNSSLMRKAMQYASLFDKIIIDHCEDPYLAQFGHANEGHMTTRLGISGIPASAEEIMVARDLLLAKETGLKVHIAHVSTKGTIELIRRAKAKGIKVTCEVTPHHLFLNDKALEGYNTNAKVNPPLRSEEDRKAVEKALIDGTIDVIATDHAPHHEDEKDIEFDKAAFGIVGLETALGLILTNLYAKGKMSLSNILEKLTTNPAKILGLKSGALTIGYPADITIIDPKLKWTVDKNKFYSKAQNTPFNGITLLGKAVATIVDGKIIYSDKNFTKQKSRQAV